MSNTSMKRDAALRTAEGVFKVWQDRTRLVKEELAAVSAANDAKTLRLKALRLERLKHEAGKATDANLPPEPTKKRAAVRRVNV